MLFYILHTTFQVFEKKEVNHSSRCGTMELTKPPSTTHKGVIHMTALYHKDGVVGKLKEEFERFFRSSDGAYTQASV